MDNDDQLLYLSTYKLDIMASIRVFCQRSIILIEVLNSTTHFPSIHGNKSLKRVLQLQINFPILKNRAINKSWKLSSFFIEESNNKKNVN